MDSNHLWRVPWGVRMRLRGKQRIRYLGQHNPVRDFIGTLDERSLVDKVRASMILRDPAQLTSLVAELGAIPMYNITTGKRYFILGRDALSDTSTTWELA